MPNVADVTVGVSLDTRPAESQINTFLNKRRTLALDDKISTQLQSITKNANEFDTSLTRATNRVFAFAAAGAVLNQTKNAFNSFIKATIEVEDSLTKIQVNLNETSDGLKKFGADLFNVARQTGKGFEETAKAAEEFARQGLGAEETIKRTRDALILSRIAAIDTTEAVNDLTGAVNSYAKEALSTTDILNKFVALDTRFAVSSKDLADGLQRAGSVAADAGVSIDKFLGIITAVKQTTGRDGAIIGNALKTIFERTRQPETLKQFSDLGIATKNLKGEILPIDQILQNLAATYDKLSESQQQQVSKSVANIQQINVFKALLGDLTKAYSVTAQAAEVSANATDEALQKNIALNKTLASAITNTGTTIQQFFANLGKQDTSGFLKDILGNFEKLRSFLSGDSGDKLGETVGDGLLKGISNVLTGPGLVAVVAVLGNAFKKVIQTVGKDIQGLIGINNVSSQRAEIQTRINALIAQATDAEKVQIATATTLLERETALLAVKERIVALGAGTGFADSIIGRGTAKGLKIPSFADPLTSAIEREMAAGVPRSQIYVDKDQRLISSDNPQGLLIANRRDEPVGGFQGVNRVLAQGGDPRKGGGRVPTFADARRGRALSNAEIIAQRFGIDDPRYDGGTSKTGRAPDALAAALARSATETEKVNSQAQKLASTLEAVNKGFSSFSNSLRANQYDSPIGPAFKPKINFNGAGNLYSLPSNVGSGPGDVSTIPRAVRQSELDHANDILQRNSALRNPRSAARPSSASLLGDNLIEDAISYDTALPDIERHNAGLAAEANRIPEARAKALRQSELRKRASDLVNAEKARRARISIAAEEEAATRKLARRQRLEKASFGLLLAAPIAAGFIPEGQGGTAEGKLAGAASGALNGAGIGAVAGPVGAGIGAAVGAIAGYLNKASQSLEEFTKQVDDSTATQRSVYEGATNVRQINSQIGDLKRDGGDPRAVERLEKQRLSALQNISDPTVRNRLAQGFGNSNDESAFFDKLGETLAAQTNGGNVSKQFKAAGEKRASSKIGDFLTGLEGPLGKFGTAVLTGGLSVPLGQTGRALQSFGADTVEQAATKRSALSQSVFSTLTKDNIGGINLRGLGATGGIANDEQVKRLTDIFKSLGAEVEVTTENYQDNLKAVFDATRAFKELKANLDKGNAGQSRGFDRSVLANQPNVDVFSNTASLNHNPLAGRGARGEAAQAAFGELRGAGLLGTLDSSPEYKKSLADTQNKRILEIAASFIKGNNPNAGRLTDNQGDISSRAVQSALKQTAGSGGSNSALAKALLDRVIQGEETVKESGAGVKLLQTSVNPSSGIIAGLSYGAFAKSQKRGGKGYYTTASAEAQIDHQDKRSYINSQNVAGVVAGRNAYKDATGTGTKYDLTQEATAAPSTAPTDYANHAKSVNDDIANALKEVNAATAKTAALLANSTLKVSLDVQGLADALTSTDFATQLQSLIQDFAALSSQVNNANGTPNPPSSLTKTPAPPPASSTSRGFRK